MCCVDMRLALITLLVIGVVEAVRVSDRRVVFQTSFGDIEFGVYEDVRGLSCTGARMFIFLQQVQQHQVTPPP